MFDLGWSELLLIGIVALIVVGPKDLPGLFRTAGQFMGKARGMAREFSRAMEAAADEAGVKEVQQTLRAAANPKAFGTEKLRAATGTSRVKKGGATEALSKERAEAKQKILSSSAKAAEARRARQAAVPDPGADPAPPADAPVPDPDAPKPAGEP